MVLLPVPLVARFSFRQQDRGPIYNNPTVMERTNKLSSKPIPVLNRRAQLLNYLFYRTKPVFTKDSRYPQTFPFYVELMSTCLRIAFTLHMARKLLYLLLLIYLLTYLMKMKVSLVLFMCYLKWSHSITKQSTPCIRPIMHFRERKFKQEKLFSKLTYFLDKISTKLQRPHLYFRAQAHANSHTKAPTNIGLPWNSLEM
jgi:hypothetical protein